MSEPYVDFDTLLSWVRTQGLRCQDGKNQTHMSLMFGEVERRLSKLHERDQEIEALKHDLEQAMGGRTSEANARIAAECRLDRVRAWVEDQHDALTDEQIRALRALVAPVVERSVSNDRLEYRRSLGLPSSE